MTTNQLIAMCFPLLTLAAAASTVLIVVKWIAPGVAEPDRGDWALGSLRETKFVGMQRQSEEIEERLATTESYWARAAAAAAWTRDTPEPWFDELDKLTAAANDDDAARARELRAQLAEAKAAALGEKLAAVDAVRAATRSLREAHLSVEAAVLRLEQVKRTLP